MKEHLIPRGSTRWCEKQKNLWYHKRPPYLYFGSRERVQHQKIANNYWGQNTRWDRWKDLANGGIVDARTGKLLLYKRSPLEDIRESWDSKQSADRRRWFRSLLRWKCRECNDGDLMAAMKMFQMQSSSADPKWCMHHKRGIFCVILTVLGKASMRNRAART